MTKGESTERSIIRHIYTSDNYSREDIISLCQQASQYRETCSTMDGRKRMLKVLKGRVISLLFYEPSTRTCCSFHSAALQLGASVIPVDVGHSSVVKGETLQDTLRTLEQYSDAIVMRHPESGVFQRMIPFVKVPLISGGDGSGEHPTQALLDMFTIYSHRNNVLDGLTVTMVGDLKYGRTVHSLSRLLSRFSGITIHYVSPDELKMPQECMRWVRQQSETRGTGDLQQFEHSELSAELIAKTDVLYVTRMQKERFLNVEDFEAVKDTFVINAKTLSHAKKDMIVMHPLPRVNELAEEIDNDGRCVYFDQMKCGVYMRMALLANTLSE